MTSNVVYTIGHSTHSGPILIYGLKQAGVKTLCDVRSRPRSKHHPQFNKKSLSRLCAEAKIKYVWAGKELGGAEQTDQMKEKLKRPTAKRWLRMQIGISSNPEPICIMCAEYDIKQCHRCDLADAIVRLKLAKVVNLQMKGFKVLKEEHTPFKPLTTEVIPAVAKEVPGAPKPIKRAFCWTHHSYGEAKIEHVEDFTAANGLTGFMVTGWPGIIVLEGPVVAVNTLLQDLLSMVWLSFEVRITQTDTQRRWQRFTLSRTDLSNRVRGSGDKPNGLSKVMELLTDAGFAHLYDKLVAKITLEAKENWNAHKKSLLAAGERKTLPSGATVFNSTIILE